MRHRPLAVLLPVLGGIAMAYMGVAVLALNTHPQGLGAKADPSVLQFESTALDLIQRGIVSRSNGLRAFDASQGSEADIDRDGRVTVADVLARFRGMTLVMGPSHGGEVSLGKYLLQGGSAVVFDALDANGDSQLTPQDILEFGQGLVQDPGHVGLGGGGPQQGSGGAGVAFRGDAIIDPRNGRTLELDPLRTSWLLDLAALDGGGHWRWKGKAIPAGLLERAAFGTLSLVDGRKVAGFMTRNGSTTTVTMVGMDGELAEYPQSGTGESAYVSWQDSVDSGAPGRKWLEAMKTLVSPDGATNAAAWSALATEFHGTAGMANEAEDAAKRALIYEPWRKDLWPIVRVVERDGQLVRLP